MLHFLFDLMDDIMGYGLMKNMTSSPLPATCLYTYLSEPWVSKCVLTTLVFLFKKESCLRNACFDKGVLRQCDTLGRLLVDEWRWGVCQHWGL